MVMMRMALIVVIMMKIMTALIATMMMVMTMMQMLLAPNSVLGLQAEEEAGGEVLDVVHTPGEEGSVPRWGGHDGGGEVGDGCDDSSITTLITPIMTSFSNIVTKKILIFTTENNRFILIFIWWGECHDFFFVIL